MKKIGRIFAAGLMMASLLFSGCKPAVEPDTGSGSGGNGSGDKKVHSVDLTELLEFAVFRQSADFGDCYQYIFDVSDAFIALPKKGDEIEYKITGSFSENVGNISVGFLDAIPDSNDKYFTVSEKFGIENVQVKANQDFTVRNKVAVTGNAAESVLLQISYSKENLDKKAVFIPKGKSIGEKYKVDLTDCMSLKRIVKNEWSGRNYQQTFNVTDAFSVLPKEGDLVEFTLEGSFTEDIDELKFQFADTSEKAGYWLSLSDRVKRSDLNIKANEPFVLKETVIFLDDLIENITIQLLYHDEVLDKESMFVPKGVVYDPKTHTVDLTSYMPTGVLKQESWWSSGNYILGYPIKDAFGAELPKSGDTLEFTIEGKFSNDIENLSLYFVDTSPKANYWTLLTSTMFVKNIKANENTVISFTTSFTDNFEEDISVFFEYDKSEGVGKTVFTPKGCKEGTVYKVDFTPYLNAAVFGDGNDYGYGCDVSDAFESFPKKGDILEYTITGTFTTDIDEINIFSDYYDSISETYHVPFSSWNNPFAIKANQEIIISGTAIFQEDSQEPFFLKMSYHKEYDQCMFIPKGKTPPKTYKVDLAPYMNIGKFTKTEDGLCYDQTFNVTDAFIEKYETLPKKGEILEFTLEGSFTEDIGELEYQFIDRSEKAGWWKEIVKSVKRNDLNIKSNEPFVLKGKVIFYDEPIEDISIRLIYLKEVLDKESFFTPKGKENQKIYKIDFTDYLKRATFGDWGDDYGYYCFVSEAFETLPKKGDILDYSFTGTFTADIDKLSIYGACEISPGEHIYPWANWVKPVDIKANQEITISGVASFEADVQEEIKFNMQYSKEYGQCMFLPKGSTLPKTYEVDLTEYLSVLTFTAPYYNSNLIDVSDAFTEKPQTGDEIKYTFTGNFSADIDKINIWLGTFDDKENKFYTLGANWNMSAGIKKNQEITISNIIDCEMDSLEQIGLQVSYSEDYGAAVFTPQGWSGDVFEIYEVDLTPYLSAVDIVDGEHTFDVSEAFQTINTEDRIVYSLTGSFSKDIEGCYALLHSDSSLSSCYTVDFKAGEYNTIYGTAVVKDVPYVPLTYELELSYPKEYGNATFTPAGWVEPSNP